MALKQEEFESLVQQLEGYACQHPKRFKQRVTLLAVMGYGYILLTLLLLLWVIVTIGLLPPGSVRDGSIWMECAFFIALVLAIIILRSLWVSIPKPKGKKLHRRETPQLFEFVDKLATTLDTPKFHNILLNQEFNVLVVEVPHLGIFGWFQNYLVLGLPLMQALTLEQFHAVIAHEFGHLSNKHSRFSLWIYRIRQVWLQSLARLHKHRRQAKSGIWAVDLLMIAANGLGSLVFGWFFRRFVSIFAAHAFVLARTHEYEADRCSANLVGAQHLAEALISVAVKRRYLNRDFWREIYKQADSTQPPEAIRLMFQALHAEIPAAGKERWLKAALAEKTDISDTHPCLSERLRALGYLADAPDLLDGMIVTSAADELLGGDILEQFTAQKNEEWQKANREFWQGRFEYLQTIPLNRLELEERAKSQALTFDEKWHLCKWTAETKGGDEAIPLLQDLIAQKSYYAPANHLLGKILLEKNEASGISYIESAVSCNAELTVHSYQLVCDFLYCEQGDTERVKYYQSEIEQHYYKTIFSSSRLSR